MGWGDGDGDGDDESSGSDVWIEGGDDVVVMPDPGVDFEEEGEADTEDGSSGEESVSLDVSPREWFLHWCAARDASGEAARDHVQWREGEGSSILVTEGGMLGDEGGEDLQALLDCIPLSCSGADSSVNALRQTSFPRPPPNAWHFSTQGKRPGDPLPREAESGEEVDMLKALLSAKNRLHDQQQAEIQRMKGELEVAVGQRDELKRDCGEWEACHREAVHDAANLREQLAQASATIEMLSGQAQELQVQLTHAYALLDEMHERVRALESGEELMTAARYEQHLQDITLRERAELMSANEQNESLRKLVDELEGQLQDALRTQPAATPAVSADPPSVADAVTQTYALQTHILMEGVAPPEGAEKRDCVIAAMRSQIKSLECTLTARECANQSALSFAESFGSSASSERCLMDALKRELKDMQQLNSELLSANKGLVSANAQLVLECSTQRSEADTVSVEDGKAVLARWIQAKESEMAKVVAEQERLRVEGVNKAVAEQQRTYEARERQLQASKETETKWLRAAWQKNTDESIKAVEKRCNRELAEALAKQRRELEARVLPLPPQMCNASSQTVVEVSHVGLQIAKEGKVEGAGGLGEVLGKWEAVRHATTRSLCTETVGMRVTLDMEMPTPQAMDVFLREVREDLCRAAGVADARMQLGEVSAGSVIVEVFVHEDAAARGDRCACCAAMRLCKQCCDANSALLSGTHTSKTRCVEIVSMLRPDQETAVSVSGWRDCNGELTVAQGKSHSVLLVEGLEYRGETHGQELEASVTMVECEKLKEELARIRHMCGRERGINVQLLALDGQLDHEEQYLVGDVQTARGAAALLEDDAQLAGVEEYRGLPHHGVDGTCASVQTDPILADEWRVFVRASHTSVGGSSSFVHGPVQTRSECVQTDDVPLVPMLSQATCTESSTTDCTFTQTTRVTMADAAVGSVTEVAVGSVQTDAVPTPTTTDAAVGSVTEVAVGSVQTDALSVPTMTDAAVGSVTEVAVGSVQTDAVSIPTADAAVGSVTEVAVGSVQTDALSVPTMTDAAVGSVTEVAVGSVQTDAVPIPPPTPAVVKTTAATNTSKIFGNCAYVQTHDTLTYLPASTCTDNTPTYSESVQTDDAPAPERQTAATGTERKVTNSCSTHTETYRQGPAQESRQPPQERSATTGITTVMHPKSSHTQLRASSQTPSTCTDDLQGCSDRAYRGAERTLRDVRQRAHKIQTAEVREARGVFVKSALRELREGMEKETLAKVVRLRSELREAVRRELGERSRACGEETVKHDAEVHEDEEGRQASGLVDELRDEWRVLLGTRIGACANCSELQKRIATMQVEDASLREAAQDLKQRLETLRQTSLLSPKRHSPTQSTLSANATPLMSEAEHLRQASGGTRHAHSADRSAEEGGSSFTRRSLSKVFGAARISSADEEPVISRHTRTDR